MAILSELKAQNIKPTDRPIADGSVPGLRLHPDKEKQKGQGKWVLRFASPETNKRRDIGFGTYPDVSISNARKAATAARELIQEGNDPIESRNASKLACQQNAQALTFEKATRKVHAALKPGWRNNRHAENWIGALEAYVFPSIGSRKVKDLKASDFADTLRPI